MLNLSRLSMLAALAAFGMTSTHRLAQESTAAPKNVLTKGAVTIYTAPAEELAATSLAGIADAKPMPLPQADIAPVGPTDGDKGPPRPGKPGFSPGKIGTGKLPAVDVPAAEDQPGELDDGVEPQEFGTSNHPFTTARVDTKANNVSKTYPYSASGKLYFMDGAVQYVCSASLIKRGIVVTAAHCVNDYGKKRFYTNFQFVPAKYNATAPFGTWNGGSVFVMTVYYNGTDVCAQAGVVCQNDVAVISMVPQKAAYPGTKTGWLGYGWDGYGFSPTNLSLINQLGYPASHDAGNIMQRTDSQGFVSTGMAGNTVWGYTSATINQQGARARSSPPTSARSSSRFAPPAPPPASKRPLARVRRGAHAMTDAEKSRHCRGFFPRGGSASLMQRQRRAILTDMPRRYRVKVLPSYLSSAYPVALEPPFLCAKANLSGN